MARIQKYGVQAHAARTWLPGRPGWVAAQAGELLLKLRASTGFADPTALRKAGDRNSNELLIAALAQARPQDAVLSEESADDRSRLDADRVWIVDPLDGTHEYGEEGRTDWAVHVALWERSAGGLTAGAVALPAREMTLTTAGGWPSRHDSLPWIAPHVVDTVCARRFSLWRWTA